MAWKQQISRVCGVGILTILASSGCALTEGLGGRAVPTDAPAAPAETYTIEIYNSLGAPKSLTHSLTGPTTVQSALEQVGSIRKIRSMDINVYRRVAETGRPLKMPVEFQPHRRYIRPEQDYAIHPNDLIVLRPKPSGPFDKVVNSIFGSLAQ